MKGISRSKAAHFFCNIAKHYFRVKSKLTHYQQDDFKAMVKEFDKAFQKGSRKELRHQLELLRNRAKYSFPKTYFRKIGVWTFGLMVAFFIAFGIRQTWLELMTVPTGSMRPTLKEQDKLLVSKSKFAINIPFSNGHFYFNPNELKRLQVVVLSGNDLDIQDPWTLFLGIMPVKKTFIKRLVAKPGDTLYFYGGKIYGIDKEGNEIKELQESPLLKEIEYVPYLSMLGKEKLIAKRMEGPEYTFSQYGIPYIKAFITKNDFVATEVFDGKKWSINTGATFKNDQAFHYRELFGMKNFAKVRLINETQKTQLYPEDKLTSDTGLFLEVFTLPELTQSAWRVAKDMSGAKHLLLKPNISFIPLEKKHLERIMQHMMTARFVIHNQKGYRFDYFSSVSNTNTNWLPTYPNVENGIYEFFNGVLYKLNNYGYYRLPKASPLYSMDNQNIQTLFNHGIEQHVYFSPKYGNDLLPARFAYYNDGDLYLLGHKVFDKDDQVLINYVQDQKQQAIKANSFSPFAPFIDEGPPLKDGKIDKEVIDQYGIKIPKGYYLALGDNHAVSGDSREFGLVPQNNLKGTPIIRFWPFQIFGPIWQPSTKHFTFSNIFMWAFVILLLYGFKHYKRRRYHHFIKKIEKD
jgi:signal peptidase I